MINIEKVQLHFEELAIQQHDETAQCHIEEQKLQEEQEETLRHLEDVTLRENGYIPDDAHIQCDPAYYWDNDESEIPLV